MHFNSLSCFISTSGHRRKVYSTTLSSRVEQLHYHCFHTHFTMAPTAFDKSLCGPSLDLFSKDFAHENVWELEHTDAESKVNFVNNLKLAKDGSMLGYTHLKGKCGLFSGEVKLQNAGPNHVDVTVASPNYKELSFYSKYAFDSAKKSNTLTLAAEHQLPINTTQFKCLPFSKQYSAFSLFNYSANSWALAAGAEVSGGLKALHDNHVLGLGYKNAANGKTYMVSARVLGEKDAPMKSLIGNIYAATAYGNVQNALSMALEHKFEESTTKMKFAGLWNLTDGSTPHHSYVKAKCDSDGQVAMNLFQRFNPKFAAAVGVSFNAKADPNPVNANYGFKVLLS